MNGAACGMRIVRSSVLNDAPVDLLRSRYSGGVSRIPVAVATMMGKKQTIRVITRRDSRPVPNMTTMIGATAMTGTALAKTRSGQSASETVLLTERPTPRGIEIAAERAKPDNTVASVARMWRGSTAAISTADSQTRLGAGRRYAGISRTRTASSHNASIPARLAVGNTISRRFIPVPGSVGRSVRGFWHRPPGLCPASTCRACADRANRFRASRRSAPARSS